MRSVEAAPTNSRQDSSRKDADILDAADDILDQDDFDATIAELPDQDDTFSEITDGPGITYDTADGPWVMPEAYSQEKSQDTTEDTQESDIIRHSRTKLSKSQALRQWTSQKAFNRVSNVAILKGEVEHGIANIKGEYLSRKQKTEEKKLHKYQRKANSTMFEFRRAKFARKARWAKNRLNDTSTKLSRHNQIFGEVVAEENGNQIKKRGEEYQNHKKRHIERLRHLEEKRSKLLERRILANERKKLRGQKNKIKKEHMSNYQKDLRVQLKKDLDHRMKKIVDKIEKSDRRWNWLKDDNHTSEEASISALDQAVNQLSSEGNAQKSRVNEILPQLRDAVDDEIKKEQHK
ncbi:hypothetical protein KC953_00425 [Candidatus Saccharibacteria bacterium]|nr:hypothetical protein [Candidatus Saccharibacteria bacterium]